MISGDKKITSQKKLSQSEKAYELLKWKILNTELNLGKLYTEADLCEITNLGRSPIRSALTNLQRDRLIEVLPRKGMFVRGWSTTELVELTEVRLLIETEVVRQAAELATDEQIGKLKSLLEDSRRFLKRNDRKGLMQVDHEFHIKLAETSQNSVYIELVKFLKQRSNPLWFLTITGPDRLLQVQQEHEAILQAIVNKDKKSAVKAIRKHISELTNVLF